MSYNQCVNALMTDPKPDETPERLTEIERDKAVIRSWLESSVGQLTVAGLSDIHHTLADQELGVLFRNNHFATIIKHRSYLFALVTDAGVKLGWEDGSPSDPSSRCAAQASFRRTGALSGCASVTLTATTSSWTKRSARQALCGHHRRLRQAATDWSCLRSSVPCGSSTRPGLLRTCPAASRSSRGRTKWSTRRGRATGNSGRTNATTTIAVFSYECLNVCTVTLSCDATLCQPASLPSSLLDSLGDTTRAAAAIRDYARVSVHNFIAHNTSRRKRQRSRRACARAAIHQERHDDSWDTFQSAHAHAESSLVGLGARAVGGKAMEWECGLLGSVWSLTEPRASIEVGQLAGLDLQLQELVIVAAERFVLLCDARRCV
jgi:hypothetical protein